MNNRLTVKIANSFIKRLFGIKLIGKKDAVLIMSCRDIHTYFMKKNIDVAFIDEAGDVVYSKRCIQPNSRIHIGRAKHVLERYTESKPWLVEGENIKSIIRKEDYESLPSL